MTRQAINLLGGLVVGAIVVLGLFLGALPRWQQAEDAEAERSSVELSNQGQEELIAALEQQRQQLPQLQADVAALRRQISSGPHLEQLIQVAAGLPDGARLRSIAPGTTGTPAAPAAPVAGDAPATTPDAGTDTGTSDDGFQELPVTLVLDVAHSDDAPRVLDKLRGGPRLLAIDRATLDRAASTTGKPAAYTLTVAGRVFLTRAVAR